MRYVLIYSYEDEDWIAVCKLAFRGEYELLHHRLDDGSYRYKDITESEYLTMVAFENDPPLKPVEDFCLSERHSPWTGIEYPLE